MGLELDNLSCCAFGGQELNHILSSNGSLQDHGGICS